MVWAELKPNQGKGQHFIILTSPLHHEALIEIISIILNRILNNFVITKLKRKGEKNF